MKSGRTRPLQCLGCGLRECLSALSAIPWGSCRWIRFAWRSECSRSFRGGLPRCADARLRNALSFHCHRILERRCSSRTLVQRHMRKPLHHSRIHSGVAFCPSHHSRVNHRPASPAQEQRQGYSNLRLRSCKPESHPHDAEGFGADRQAEDDKWAGMRFEM